VESYQRWLYWYRKCGGGPLSVWSQHGRLVAVRGLFRWLTKQRALSVNPAAFAALTSTGDFVYRYAP
jgi:integrase/recombinase XerD